MQKKILVVIILITAILYISISINDDFGEIYSQNFINYKKEVPNTNLKVYAINDFEMKDELSRKNKRLLFTDNDIEEYDWESHRITFTDEFLSASVNNQNIGDTQKFLHDGGSALLETTGRERFIIMIDDEVIYAGHFKQALVSSFYPLGAVISDINGGIIIDFIGINEPDKDIRNDERIRETLKVKGLLSN